MVVVSNFLFCFCFVLFHSYLSHVVFFLLLLSLPFSWAASSSEDSSGLGTPADPTKARHPSHLCSKGKSIESKKKLRVSFHSILKSETSHYSLSLSLFAS